MSELRITGGRRLSGEVYIHGAKNSVLPILAATVLVPGVSVIRNCPDLSDVRASLAILVPSPNVTADHQTKNAKVLSEHGGAVLLPESDCSGPVLYERAAGILSDCAKRDEMVRALSSQSITDAAEQIYQVLIGLIRH